MLSFKRRVAAVSALAVMAAIVPVITSSPATAAPSATLITVVQDNADYKACPASADIPSAGFTDTTDASVDCLAYYGIVKGTTATTYSPDDSVSRWQMALYLTRAATEAGVTLGTGADQGFTDISGLSAEIQTAINQIKQLGITTGKTATTYAPNDNVSRMEMALFIERWASSVSAGPGGTSDAERMTGLATTYINSNCGVGVGAACSGVYNYTDIDSGSVTVEASNAIKELYTMGIHDGATATTFNPSADMTRAAMATFMEAALNHTNLRPEGLHIQSNLYSAIGANTHTLHVSYRDASFDPITSTPVDVFRWTPTGVEGDQAFTPATGACEDAVATGASITACKIDVAEPTTDLSGNLTPTANTTAVLSQALNIAGTDNYYAWTAASGTTYDNDLHNSGTTYDTIAVVANPDDADTRCSIDTPANATTATHTVESKWGAVTTVTCQVTGGTASETAAAVPNPGVVVSMNRTRVNTNVNGVAGTATVDAENVVALTDATGAVTFTVTGPANPLKAATDVVTDTVVITTANITIGSLPTTGNSGFMTEAGGNTLTFALKYQSEASSAHSTVITQTANSALASAGVLGTTRTVTATVYDQYGDGEPAIATTFTSVNTLHQGAICTLADPTVCTLAAHGLSIGDDIQVLTKGALVGACSGDATADGGAADAGAFTITTVPTADTFTMSCSDDAVAGTTASTAASPTVFTTTSFASAARTTNAAGQATFSWVDTEITSGIDTVTATPAAGTAGSVKFYRLAPPVDYSEVGDGNTTRADSEANAGCVAIDTTAKTYIIVAHDDTDTSQSLTKYMKFSYDDNDQYGTAGGAGAALDGTPATQAAWQTAMVATCTAGGLAANPGGVVSSIASVDTGTGLSTDIQRHVLG